MLLDLIGSILAGIILHYIYRWLDNANSDNKK